VLVEAVEEHARLAGGRTLLEHAAHAQIAVRQGKEGLGVAGEPVSELGVETGCLE
jgi:hypothetical protein